MNVRYKDYDDQIWRSLKSRPFDLPEPGTIAIVDEYQLCNSYLTTT